MSKVTCTIVPQPPQEGETRTVRSEEVFHNGTWKCINAFTQPGTPTRQVVLSMPEEVAKSARGAFEYSRRITSTGCAERNALDDILDALRDAGL